MNKDKDGAVAEETTDTTQEENGFWGDLTLDGDLSPVAEEVENPDEDADKDEETEEEKKAREEAEAAEEEEEDKTKEDDSDKSEEDDPNPEDDADKDKSDSDDDKNKASGQYGKFMEGLVEKDVLSVVDEEKEYEDSPEGVRELILDNIRQGVDQGVSTYKEALPEKAKELLEFYDTHGEDADFNQFIEEASEVDFNEVDHTVVDNQTLLVEDYLTTQGYDAAEIKQTLEEYSTAGSLARHAKRAKEKLASMQATERKAREKAKEVAKEKIAKQKAEAVDAFKSNVNGLEDIAGFPVSKKDKTALIDYVTKAVDKAGHTQLQLDSKKDDSAELLYAYLKMKGLTYKSIVKGADTKSTLKLKKDLNKFTDKNVQRKSGKQKRESSNDDKLHIPDIW